LAKNEFFYKSYPSRTLPLGFRSGEYEGKSFVAFCLRNHNVLSPPTNHVLFCPFYLYVFVIYTSMGDTLASMIQGATDLYVRSLPIIHYISFTYLRFPVFSQAATYADIAAIGMINQLLFFFLPNTHRELYIFVAILAYDTGLTFNREVTFIWKRKPRLGTVLYFLARYCGLVHSMVALSTDFISDFDRVSRNSMELLGFFSACQ
jgi:hypothetical protein